jgi:hypothetical protein
MTATVLSREIVERPSQQYSSSIEHLARALLLGEFDWGASLAMYSAYFDESGTHQQSKVMVICGMVSTVEQWSHFTREWNDLLVEFEIVPPFHMKLYTPSVGQFSKWKGVETVRKEFLSRAVGIILRRVQYSVSVSLSLPDYDRVIAPDPKASRFFGSAYAMSIYQSLYLLDLWWGKYPGTPKIPCIFDRGHSNSSEVLRIVNKYSGDPRMEKKALSSVSFVSDDDHSPLQAADLVVWEIRKATVEGKVRRRSFERLLDIPHEWIHAGPEALTAVAAKLTDTMSG